MKASEIRKALAGETGGWLIGQSKWCQIPGNPPVCRGAEIGLPEGSVMLVDTRFQHVITERKFLQYLHGENTSETSHTVEPFEGVPYIEKNDPDDMHYLRIK